MEENILQINNLSIEYKMKYKTIKAVTNVTLPIKKGKVTAIVGESGGGKSTLVLSIMRSITSPGEVVNGEILYYGNESLEHNILNYDVKTLSKFRWEEVSMVFQASQSTLNPLMTIEKHFFETAYYHGKAKNLEEFRPRIEELLTYVRLEPKRVMKCYPHELSGGMKQRVMIAFSLLLNPKIIILDEPTTALDVITQNYVFDILEKINKDLGITMILLTHDISVVAKFADYVAVMYAGNVVEYADVYKIFKESKHPYTSGLINATPSLISDLNSIESIMGDTPDLSKKHDGCMFYPRCKYSIDKCSNVTPLDYKDVDYICKCHLCFNGGK